MATEAQLRAQGTDYGVFDRCLQARRWLAEAAPTPARIRVIGDDDSDGATSVHVLTTALRRAGYETDPLLQPIHNEDQVATALRGAYDAFVIADAGSSYLEALDQHDVPVLVLDHHGGPAYDPKNVFEVNPRRVAGDRTWSVSASVVSAVFAATLDRRNADVAFAGVTGGVSDRQHLHGFAGLLGHCVELAVGAGTVRRGDGLTLVGASVADAIIMSLDPYFAAYAGEPDEVHRVLDQIGVAPALPPGGLSDVEAQRVGRRLEEDLGGVPGSEEHYPIYGERLALQHPSGAPTIFHLARLVEAATALGEFDLALKLLAGGADAREEVEVLARHRQNALLNEMRRLVATPTDAKRYRWVETRDPAHTGVYAHTLLSYVFGDQKPTLVFGREGTRIRASARGSSRLYLAGLDLSKAMNEAARAAGGTGGGHPGAAGGSFPAEKLPRFLEAFDDALARLTKGAR